MPEGGIRYPGARVISDCEDESWGLNTDPL